MPASLSSTGHAYVGDSTPGAAEVLMSAGLSPAATYGSGTCQDLYCHGDGAGILGTIASNATVACGDPCSKRCTLPQTSLKHPSPL